MEKKLSNYCNYCIITMKKFKNDAAIHKVLQHHSRAINTVNADPSLVKENFFWPNSDNDEFDFDKERNTDLSFRNKNAEKAFLVFKKRLNEAIKIRRNQVIAVNMLVSCSPEVRRNKDFDFKKYLEHCTKWLVNKYCINNVFCISFHFDEATPHADVMFIPMDGEKNLCFTKLLGDKFKLRALQNEFYQQCGKPFGLNRGNAVGKASYNTLKKYYAGINTVDPKIENLFSALKKCMPGPHDYENDKDFLKKFEENFNVVKEEYQPLFNSILKKEADEEEYNKLKQKLEEEYQEKNKASFKEHLHKKIILRNPKNKKEIPCEQGVAQAIFEKDAALDEWLDLSYEDLEKVSAIMKKIDCKTSKELFDKAHSSKQTLKALANNQNIKEEEYTKN